MNKPEPIVHESYPDPHHDVYSRTTFGFWLYLLTDFILFGTLFATYAVLHNNTYGGPTARDIFPLWLPLILTVILLTGSLTIGIGGALVHRRNKHGAMIFFAITFLLGVAFMAMECADISRLLNENNNWHRSAFLSAYFTIIGTFIVHMIFALLWVIILLVPVWQEGITPFSIRRLTCLKMFWQFLTIIWVLIYFFIYLMGSV